MFTLFMMSIVTSMAYIIWPANAIPTGKVRFSPKIVVDVSTSKTSRSTFGSMRYLYSGSMKQYMECT